MTGSASCWPKRSYDCEQLCNSVPNRTTPRPPPPGSPRRPVTRPPQRSSVHRIIAGTTDAWLRATPRSVLHTQDPLRFTHSGKMPGRPQKGDTSPDSRTQTRLLCEGLPKPKPSGAGLLLTSHYCSLLSAQNHHGHGCGKRALSQRGSCSDTCWGRSGTLSIPDAPSLLRALGGGCSQPVSAPGCVPSTRTGQDPPPGTADGAAVCSRLPVRPGEPQLIRETVGPTGSPGTVLASCHPGALMRH